MYYFKYSGLAGWLGNLVKEPPMSVELCFDPTCCNNAAECLELLNSQGLSLGHRLGARVYGLGRRGIRFSLAFLDEAANLDSACNPSRECLQSAAWNSLEGQDLNAVNALLGTTGAVAVLDAQVCCILTADEVDSPRDSSMTLAKSSARSGSVLPSVLGSADAGAIRGVLWERKRLEEAGLVLLDSENDAQMIEAFRYLFRAAIACGQDPTGLMVTALKRGKPKVSLEVASLVRDSLDRQFGRALGGLLSGNSQTFKESVHFFKQPSQQRFMSVLQTIIWPALVPLVELADFRSTILPGLPQLVPLLIEPGVDEPTAAPGRQSSRRLLATKEQVETFLDALLAKLGEYELAERFAVSAFIVDLSSHYEGMAEYLLVQLANSLDPQLQVFYGSILSRLGLNDSQRKVVLGAMVRVFIEYGSDTGLSRRLRATFRNIGASALVILSSPEVRAQLNEVQRLRVVHLWHDFREGAPLPPAEVFGQYVVREFIERDRATLLGLIHSKQLNRPEVTEALSELTDAQQRALAISYLMEQVQLLEDPDDEAVLALLVEAGFTVVEQAFRLVQEESALASGGEATRVAIFGKLATRVPVNEQQLVALEQMVAELLQYNYLDDDKLPVVWTGLGEVGSIPNLSAHLQKQIVTRLGDKLERFPEAKVAALVKMYGACHQEARVHIEGLLRRVLASPEPSRKVLQFCLSGLKQLVQDGPGLVEARQLVGELCRTVLNKSEGTDLELVMRQAISAEAEGDGVQLPVAWDKQDRDSAMEVLGALAISASTSAQLQTSVIYRLFSFLDDWLDGIEKGYNLYAYRDTPLWSILCQVLESQPSELTLKLAQQASLRTMEQYHQRLEGLDLTRRENTQKFLIAVLRLEPDNRVQVRGIEIDLGSAIMHTLMQVARESPAEIHVTEHLLRELLNSRTLPAILQAELDASMGCSCGHCDN